MATSVLFTVNEQLTCSHGDVSLVCNIHVELDATTQDRAAPSICWDSSSAAGASYNNSTKLILIVALLVAAQQHQLLRMRLITPWKSNGQPTPDSTASVAPHIHPKTCVSITVTMVQSTERAFMAFWKQDHPHHMCTAKRKRQSTSLFDKPARNRSEM